MRNELQNEIRPDAQPAHSVDRRRPGRMESANPELIALMRTPAQGALAEPQAAIDDLRAARGIALSCGIGTTFWVVIILLACS